MIPFNALDRQHTDALGSSLAGAFARVLRGGWYVLGREVEAFEREFADYIGVRHAIGVGNGSDALELAIAALGLPATSRILVAPNAAMYATLAILANGCEPAFVDVDPVTAILDPDAIDASITPDARAIVVTHLYGRLAPMDRIVDRARRHGLAVIEDCAQAHGAMRDGRRAASFGDVGCFSFYPTKNLGALGDGGAVVTSHDDVAARVRRLRQYGWSTKYEVSMKHGRNSRLDELQAALLRIKLPHLDAWNARRRAIARRYAQNIVHSAIEAPYRDGDDDVAHLYVVRSPERDALRAHLTHAGVGTDVHYPLPDHRQPIFAGRYADVRLAAAESLAQCVLSLPCFPELSDDEVDTVIRACNAWSAPCDR